MPRAQGSFSFGRFLRIGVLALLAAIVVEQPVSAHSAEVCFWLCGLAEVNCILQGGNPCTLCSWDFIMYQCHFPTCCWP